MKIQFLKRALTAALMSAALVFSSCSTDLLRDEIQNIHQEMDQLRADLNNEVDKLMVIIKALQENDYVKSVVPCEDKNGRRGYTLLFAKGGEVKIYDGLDGQDGHSPALGVKKYEADGLFYWTLDGEWLLDGNNQMISAQGMKPEFKIEDGNVKMSFDGGKNWQNVGTCRGDSIFDMPVIEEDKVILTIYKGTDAEQTFEIPLYKEKVPVSIKFNMEGNETGVMPGKTIHISYELEHADSNAVVSASTSGLYTVAVKAEGKDYTKGTISVRCPETFIEGFINVLVSDGYGYTFFKVINFYENKIEFSEGLEYHLACTAGQISIPYSSNFTSDVKVVEGQDWLSITPATRAEMKEDSLVLAFTRNTLFAERTAKVEIYMQGDSTESFQVLNFIQAPAVFEIEEKTIDATADSMQVEIPVVSSLGLTVADCPEWITAKIVASETEADHFVLTLDIAKNTEMAMRSAEIKLLSDDGLVNLETLFVNQLGVKPERENMMVFKLIESYVNNGKVVLPFTGRINCTVNWGDGSEDEDFKTGQTVEHIYTGDFQFKKNEVTVWGFVENLNSARIEPSIEELIQWGDLKLEAVDSAFFNQRHLKKVAVVGVENLSGMKSFNAAFEGCTPLRSVSADLFASCPEVTSFNAVFKNCKFLSDVPVNIFDNNKKVIDFESAFENTTIGKESPYTMVGEKKVHLYERASYPDQFSAPVKFANCFKGCYQLEGLDQIPADWKGTETVE